MPKIIHTASETATRNIMSTKETAITPPTTAVVVVTPIISIPGLPQLKWLDTTSSTTRVRTQLIGNATLDETNQSITMTTTKETDWFNPPPAPAPASINTNTNTTTTTTESPAALCNAPALVFQRDDDCDDDDCDTGDWQLSVKITMHHTNLFDAGTLFLHQGPNDWCKLCFEYSPECLPTIVSVVTQDISDDANGPSIINSNNNSSSNSISSNTPTSSVYLRVSKYASVIAFHYSLDNDNGNKNNADEETTKTNTDKSSSYSDEQKQQQQQQQNQYWTLHRVFSMRNINKIPMSIGFLAQAPVGPDSCTAVFSEIQYFPQKTLQNLRDGS